MTINKGLIVAIRNKTLLQWTMSLFQESIKNKYLKTVNSPQLKEKYKVLTDKFHNIEFQERLKVVKEEAYQDGFLNDLFVDVLGYTLFPNNNHNLIREAKNKQDSKKADGAIVLNESVNAIIELKGMNTSDLDKVTEQAFNYKNSHRNCHYVIISNFQKIRFYIGHKVDYLEFDLFTITEEQFKLLWLCLSLESIKESIPLTMQNVTIKEEENITKALYKDYSAFKKDLFVDIVKSNPQYDRLLLFKKTQKLLDRFLFIFFAEDRGLIPVNLTDRMITNWRQALELDIEENLYDRINIFFTYLNKGIKKSDFEIFAYNGGLFYTDDILDTLVISDTLLEKHLTKLSSYNYLSDVDVNILGHIFENSLNEIEEITAELESNNPDSLDRIRENKTSKRKKYRLFLYSILYYSVHS